MSDDFHRPTLTYPPSKAYNATQARLYGIAAKGGFVFPRNPLPLDGTDMNVSVHIYSDKDDEYNASVVKQLDELRKKEKPKISDAQLFEKLVRGTLTLADDAPIGWAYQLPFDVKKLGTVAVSVSISLGEAAQKQKIISCGIIVGYAYEGHTYDLPKPKVMIIPALPEPKIPADDSGFDKKESEGYAVWIVDKLDECVELEVNQGFIEQLVLEANLPGKRAPSMYAGRMMLGHRSGRLAE